MRVFKVRKIGYRCNYNFYDKVSLWYDPQCGNFGQNNLCAIEVGLNKILKCDLKIVELGLLQERRKKLLMFLVYHGKEFPK